MIESDFEPISVALTRDEYGRSAARARLLAKRFPYAKPHLVRLVNFVRLTAAPIIIVVGLKTVQPVSASAGWGFFAILVAYGAFYAWLSRTSVFLRWIPLESGSILRPATITVTDQGLELVTVFSQHKLGWGAMRMVDDHAGLILIFVDRTAAVTVPRRSFQDGSSADRFVALLKSKIAVPVPVATVFD